VSVGRVKAQANNAAPEQQQTVPMDWMVVNNDFALDFLCSGFRREGATAGICIRIDTTPSVPKFLSLSLLEKQL